MFEGKAVLDIKGTEQFVQYIEAELGMQLLHRYRSVTAAEKEHIIVE